ncbi:MAG: DUF2318 domain-containing protein [Planctomycetota bacterium]|jgi:uncharacterized membrane protein|nr:DUF2318 domain-containing protein [Planctomycetota bacterium]
MFETPKRMRLTVASLFILAIAPALSASGGEVRDSDLVIPAGEVSSRARYYSAVIEGYSLQLFAVTAPDETIRVVFNACQACGPAGFTQDKDSMVCSACRQRFKLSDLERQRGGCNPIPVGEKNRSRNANGDIVISRAFLKQVKDYFSRQWPRGI